MRHQDLTLNHILESWTYANAAARTGATGFVAGDIGRISYQSDTGQYWRLTATTPAWALLPGSVAPGGTVGQVLTKNSGTNYDVSWLAGVGNITGFAPATPTGTSNTTGVMMGFGGTVRYTPTRSGKLIVTYMGTMQTAGLTGVGAQGIIMIGTTGTAPLNGAAITGTAIGGTYTVPIVLAGGGSYGFVSVVAGTTVSLATNYWFDITLRSFGTAGTVTPNGNYFLIVEL